MNYLREYYLTTSLTVKTKVLADETLQTRCVAQLEMTSERRAIKLVASRGMINKDVALALYSHLKGKLSADAAARKIKEIFAAPVEPKVTNRVIKSKKTGAKRSLSASLDAAASQDPDAAAAAAEQPATKVVMDIEAADEEVSKVRSFLTPSFTAGLLDNIGTWRPATAADAATATKKRHGRVAVDLGKAPGALRVATGIKRFLGVGKMSSGRVKLVFSTVKELNTLKSRLGEEIRFAPVESLVLE